MQELVMKLVGFKCDVKTGCMVLDHLQLVVGLSIRRALISRKCVHVQQRQ